MSEPNKRITKKVLLTRVICGILAILMVGSIIYSAVYAIIYLVR